MSKRFRSLTVLVKTVGLVCVRLIGAGLRKCGWKLHSLGYHIEKWAKVRLSDKGGQGE